MSSWTELTNALEALSAADRGQFIIGTINGRLAEIGQIRGSNVMVYASAYLQKPFVPPFVLSINPEDINGVMTCLKGMDFNKPLTLVLHSPGGSGEAAETIVNYLYSKFSFIEAVIPVYAMSAGTMMALAANKLVMGRQSQLGPTDPQLFLNNSACSAHSIIEQFEEAKAEISQDPDLASAWAPVLAPFGPALLQEARKADKYGKSLVRQWLAARMFKGQKNSGVKASKVANFFGGKNHGSHGHRIDRDECVRRGLKVENLESSEEFQEAVLTLYHALTIAFEQGPATKIVMSTSGGSWMKNINFSPAAPTPAGAA